MSRADRPSRGALPIVLTVLALIVPGGGVLEGQAVDNPNRPLPEDEYLWWQLPASEAAYERIDGYRIKRHVEEIAAIARRSRDDGNPHWGIIAGQPYHDEARAWIAAHFERLGLEDVQHQIYDLDPQWVPVSWELSVTAEGRTTRLESAHVPYGAVGTPAAGIDLDPVWVGLGAESDFLGRDVRGKAVFIIALPRPTARGHSGHPGARRAVERGAAAIVWVYGLQGNPAIQPMGARYPIPAFTVGLHDGELVEGLIGGGQGPMLHLRSEVERVPGLQAGDVYGVLPGTTDENIVVVAHFDSFFEGALDNASGVAGMVALAEYFAALPREDRTRNLIFAGICCHHGGAGLGGSPTGSFWMVEAMRRELDLTALVLNMEHLSQTQTYAASPGSRGYALPDGLVYSNTVSARRWFASGTETFREMVARTWRDFGVAIYAAPETRPGGELGAFPPVAPSLHIIDHTFYHTSMDTPDLVPAAGLQNTVQAFAKIIDEVDTMEMREIRGELYP